MKDQIEKAVAILKTGGLVAFPTETVYGLGADATNPLALRKIFIAKNRPMDHPVIIHIASIEQLSLWAREIPGAAFKLAQAFWPGPLSLILKKAANVDDLVTGGQDTIGIRMPAHPMAQRLLTAFGKGVAAPSANRFGRISPTTAEAVEEELAGVVDCILPGGQCEVGVESTIVDVSGESVKVLRPGMISVAQIEAVLQKPVSMRTQHSPRAAGCHEVHYAPQTRTELMDTSEIESLILSSNEKIGWVLITPLGTLAEVMIHMSPDPVNYAHDLYQILRDLDKQGLDKIVIEKVPETPEWDAIRDRLHRAAAK